MAAGLARFKSTLVYEAEAPAEQVLVDLQEIREFDQQSEARLRIWKILTLVSVLIVGPGSCLGVSQALGPRYSQGIFFTCLTVGGIGLITGIVLWVRGARLDLANRRYELCAELMRLLGRDMAKDAPLSVALDLARPNERRKKSDVGQVRDWKVTYFQDPWLRLRGKFADGTTFQITMIEKFQARSKWKRSRSGKNKHKSKTKTSTLASFLLFPKKKRQEGVAQVAGQARNLVRLPQWGQLKSVTATGEELSLVARTSAEWSVRRQTPNTQYDGLELVGKMLLSLYQVMHVAEK